MPSRRGEFVWPIAAEDLIAVDDRLCVRLLAEFNENNSRGPPNHAAGHPVGLAQKLVPNPKNGWMLGPMSSASVPISGLACHRKQGR
jgi:hypothetical protein